MNKRQIIFLNVFHVSYVARKKLLNQRTMRSFKSINPNRIPKILEQFNSKHSDLPQNLSKAFQ